MPSTITYPVIRRDPCVSDTYCDRSSSTVIINDPYRWLEDPDSEETAQFVSEQNIISQAYLNNIPYRTKFFEHLKEIFNIPKFSCPSKQPNGKYYYYMNTGLQNQDVYYELDSLSKSTDQAQILIDPNTFSEDGTVAIQSLNFSYDGKILCYSVSDAGSDWSTIYFMDVATRKKLDDVIIRTKFSSLRWTTDNRGIFYSTYADALNNTTSNNTNLVTTTKNENKTEEDKDTNKTTDKTTNEVPSATIEVIRTDIQEVYFHRLGTPRSSDICLARSIDDLNEHFFSVETSDDGQYLIASISIGTLNENKLWFLPLYKSSDSIVEQPNWSKLIDNMDFVYNFVTSQDDLLYVTTNAQAENFRLITINTKTKEIKEVIAEDKNDLLEDVTRVYEKYFLVRYLSHVKSILYLYEMETGRQLRKFDLPIGNISAWGDQNESEIFIRLESFLSPTTIYTCDLAQSLDASVTIFKRIEFNGVDLNALTTEQVFVDSNGLDPSNPVKVPMFLVHKKDLQKNGQNPTHLYVYGGFSIGIKPFFSVAALLWIHHFNGVFAVVNARGGAEYGEVWHKDGYKHKKKNTYLDLCASTEWLIENKYTKSEKVSITGGSNGGLTVAACANMRPDLFACVVIQVGVLDLYRYHKFTIGYYWCGEYGNPGLPEEFEWVKTISPLHNIPTNPTKYPAILVITADHDDRVVPAHSFKYISQLQYQLGETMNRLGRPLISRIDVRAGHGAGKPTIKRIEELSDIYSTTPFSHKNKNIQNSSFSIKVINLVLEMSSPREKLIKNLQSLCNEHGLTWDDQLSNDIPRKWRVHGDMLLLPSNRCFVDSRWINNIPSDQFWSTVARSFGSSIKRIAFEGPIKNDDFRSPNTRLVLGNDPWINLVENGIKFSYNVDKSMFCAGNNTERMRMGQISCVNETIVDLYAGIGYFTLPFLVHGHARHVYACEWNPDSMEALRRNLQANHIDEDRYTLLLGDNQLTCPVGIADRCNLGLIPSSEACWPVACRALQAKGGRLHVHGVVNTKQDTHDQWSENVRYRIETLMRDIHHGENNYKCEIEHVERVKPYGPHLDHLVVDLLLTKISSSS
ncbi:unnamed protein product [Rotaria sp. Silwood2]|nr:unnamed protein product [Rotaria sp. Silwood2]